MAMATAAGVSFDAALAHGLIDVKRRPREAARITCALRALAVTAGEVAGEKGATLFFTLPDAGRR
jgi:hypothetical protein